MRKYEYYILQMIDRKTKKRLNIKLGDHMRENYNYMRGVYSKASNRNLGTGKLSLMGVNGRKKTVIFTRIIK
jgi:hypothetical protein